MVRTQKPLHARLGKDRAQEPRGDIAFKQSVAVLGKYRVVPRRIIDAGADEPAGRTPVAPSTAAPNESNRTLAAASPVTVSPEGSTAAQSANTTPKSRSPAPPALRSQARG